MPKSKFIIEPSDTQESWLPLPSAPAYCVSDLGRVKRVLGGQGCKGIRVLRPCLSKDGYHRVSIHRQSRAIHRLVAETFIGLRPPGMQVNHKDGVKINNRPRNLEYVTQQENLAHAARLGLTASGPRNGRHTHPERTNRGERHFWAKLTQEQVAAIRVLLNGPPLTLRSIANKFNISACAIVDIKKGRTWKG